MAENFAKFYFKKFRDLGESVVIDDEMKKSIFKEKLYEENDDPNLDTVQSENMDTLEVKKIII